jgi:MYXO-CTERM domain-containing protein
MALVVCLFAGTGAVHAGTITFYYTTLGGGAQGNNDVFSNTYNTTTGLGTPVGIGSTQQGADGIEDGPTVAGTPTLFFTGETDQNVFQIPITGGSSVSNASSGITAYLLSVNPGDTALYTFNNAGSISSLAVTGGGLIAGPGTVHTVTGADTNVSRIVWGSNPAGPVYYITGAPGSNGDLGTINLSTYVTTQLDANITTAEDAHYDPYTGMIVLFGQGQINTLNPTTGVLGTAITLPAGTCGSSTLTTGDFDGLGHALVTDCGTLYYLDFSATHNELTGTVTAIPGTFGGKDIEIFQTTTGTPEPATMGFALFGLALVAFRRFRRG